MVNALLVAGSAACALMAIRSERLLSAALWLAGVSALVSIVLYRLGAQQVAVIELSVGAGLVTVLFVFAISIAGDDAMVARELLPRPLAIGLVLAFLALLVYMALPVEQSGTATVDVPFATVLWTDRVLDVLLQIVLIFSGVLCLIGLLGDRTPLPEQKLVTTVEGVEVRAYSGTNGHREREKEEELVLQESVVDEVRA